jgi:hypothetical protein
VHRLAALEGSGGELYVRILFYAVK